MISLRTDQESISITEFVMLLMILLLILFGFITSNPNYILESLIICIIGVIMLSVYLYVKRLAKHRTLNIRIDETNHSNQVIPSIGIITAIFPININNLQELNLNQDLTNQNPPSYSQINLTDGLPSYEETIQNQII